MRAAARTGLEGDQVQDTVAAYRRSFDEQSGGSEEDRKRGYGAVVNQYYDLVTDFYEYGWGQSFHFAVRRRDERLEAAILRHEHYLALRLGLERGASVLDVGCGVGGPARNIAAFCGARVTGLNINAYQLQRARAHTAEAGLEALCSYVEGDFMEMPGPDGAYDAAYAIESTCHAPDRSVVFGEVNRVLRPGGLFAGYEWCTTDRYDAGNPEHREIARGIEEGDGLPALTHYREVDRALAAAGFELLEARDLVGECAPETPWYLPLAGGDLSLAGFSRSMIGRRVTGAAVRLMELAKLAPAGASQVHDVLNRGADNLVAGGRLGIFTPMYFFVARKAGGAR